MTRYLSKESMQMAKKHKKKCTTSVDIREMPIKTTTRYHVVPTTRAKMKTDHSKYGKGCVESSLLVGT